MSRAQAQVVVGTPRNAVPSVLSTRAVATVVDEVERIVSLYLVPSVSVRTMASPTSVVAGYANVVALAVIVRVAAGVQSLPVVTVTVVAVVFVPS